MKQLLRAMYRAALFFLFFSLFWNTVDIVLRRWWWGQIPSQVSAPVVYGLLTANLLIIIFGLWSGLRIVRASFHRPSYKAIS